MRAQTPSNPPQRVGENKPTSYLGEMLKHPININIGMASLAGAALLAFPLGLAGAALPLLAFGAGEAIAAMFVPSSGRFRDWVNRKRSKQQSEQLTAHLTAQIIQMGGRTGGGWKVFERMLQRANALRELARNRPDTLTEAHLQQVDNAPIDYLALWLARLTVEDRLEALRASDLKRRLGEIDERLKAQTEPDRTLLKAKADTEDLLARRERLITRLASQDAALVALPDAVEEIYQSAITSSAGGDGNAKLQGAVARLRIEEDLSASIEQELSAT